MIKNNNLLSEYKDVLTFKELQQILRLGKNKTYELLQIRHYKIFTYSEMNIEYPKLMSLNI